MLNHYKDKDREKEKDYKDHNSLKNSMTNLKQGSMSIDKRLSESKTINAFHKKSESCLEFKNEKQEGAVLNIMTGQIVKNDNLNTIDEINNDEQNDENFKEFVSEYEKENNLKDNILYASSASKLVKYYDYSSKFGIVYMISNEYNYLGICFNDFTTLIQNSSLSVIDNKHKLIYNYFDKDHRNIANFDENSLDLYSKGKSSSKDLTKKCEIMKQILIKHSQEVQNLKPIYEKNEISNYNLSKLVIVKDFIKVQQAIMFRLSNKLVQIIFADQSEVILSTESTDCIFKDKSDEEFFDSISNIMSSDNVDVIKRIKFSKNLMLHFVKTFKSQINSQPQKNEKTNVNPQVNNTGNMLNINLNKKK